MAPTPPDPRQLARTLDYVRLLAVAGLIGVPVSLAAFAFLTLLHGLTHYVWEYLPDQLGHETPPWWWPAPWLAIGGVLVGLATRYLPGRGGHVPITGLAVDAVPASHVPGILLAALGGLPLGAVLGPEAPLIAIGSATALMLTGTWAKSRDEARSVLGVSGAAAAVAVIFGSPLVAAVFILEAVGLAVPKASRIILPALLASGIGALIFTGLGSWTGFAIASLSLPDLAVPARPDLADLLWTIPAAIAIAYAVRQIHRGGAKVAQIAARRPMTAAIAAALFTAVCAGAYTLLTARSPVEVTLSGQESLSTLATDASDWPLWILAVLLVCKGLAYAAALGALRGGPIFPALFLGAAAGVLLSGLPGYGAVPALAAGMAAAVASIMPLPVSAAVLVTLLLGANASALTPIVLVAVVVAFVSEQIASRRRTAAESAAEQPASA